MTNNAAPTYTTKLRCAYCKELGHVTGTCPKYKADEAARQIGDCHTDAVQGESPASVQARGEPIKTDAEKYEELARVSAQLCKVIALVHQDPEWKRVWQLYAVHGFTYRGPHYDKAAMDVLDVLAAHKKDTQQ